MSKRRRLRRPVCRGTVEIKADEGTSRKRTAEHEVWGQVLVGAEATGPSLSLAPVAKKLDGETSLQNTSNI